MPKQILAELLRKEQIIKNVYKFTIKAEEIVKLAKPGNFIEIKVNNQTEPFLRRPISIYNIEVEHGILEFIFQVKGKGTQILAQKNIGEKIDIIGPLGYGTFKIGDKTNVAIIGGGIGIFPLYELAKQITEQKKRVNGYLGFRTKDLVMLENEFTKITNNLTITTDDGTYGKNGFAINYLIEDMKKEKYECIYACGPLPMLRSLQEYANKNNIECQISLEEKMGCGLGVCLGCAVKTAKSSKESPKYFQVCKGGPVFNSRDVEF